MAGPWLKTHHMLCTECSEADGQVLRALVALYLEAPLALWDGGAGRGPSQLRLLPWTILRHPEPLGGHPASGNKTAQTGRNSLMNGEADGEGPSWSPTVRWGLGEPGAAHTLGAGPLWPAGASCSTIVRTLVLTWAGPQPCRQVLAQERSSIAFLRKWVWGWDHLAPGLAPALLRPPFQAASAATRRLNQDLRVACWHHCCSLPPDQTEAPVAWDLQG